MQVLPILPWRHRSQVATKSSNYQYCLYMRFKIVSPATMRIVLAKTSNSHMLSSVLLRHPVGLAVASPFCTASSASCTSCGGPHSRRHCQKCPCSQHSRPLGLVTQGRRPGWQWWHKEPWRKLHGIFLPDRFTQKTWHAFRTTAVCCNLCWILHALWPGAWIFSKLHIDHGLIVYKVGLMLLIVMSYCQIKTWIPKLSANMTSLPLLAWNNEYINESCKKFFPHITSHSQSETESWRLETARKHWLEKSKCQVLPLWSELSLVPETHITIWISSFGPWVSYMDHRSHMLPPWSWYTRYYQVMSCTAVVGMYACIKCGCAAALQIGRFTLPLQHSSSSQYSSQLIAESSLVCYANDLQQIEMYGITRASRRVPKVKKLPKI